MADDLSDLEEAFRLNLVRSQLKKLMNRCHRDAHLYAEAVKPEWLDRIDELVEEEQELLRQMHAPPRAYVIPRSWWRRFIRR